MDIPERIQQRVDSLFSPITVQKAQRLVGLKGVSTSFQKGGPDSYLICSGIVQDGRSHSCKIVYKKRKENSPSGPLSSSCDCHQWGPEHHCPHVAALFLLFLLSHEGPQGPDTPMVSVDFLSGHAVSVEEFGQIVWGPQYLQGANGLHSYSALQYLLVGQKVAHFPLPEKLDEPLHLNLSADGPEVKMTFSLGHTAEISLFENLYLFDWKKGRAFHLPENIQSFVQKLKHDSSLKRLSPLINYWANHGLTAQIKLSIEGLPFEEIPQVDISPRLSIDSGKKKGHLRLSLHFLGPQGEFKKIPQVLQRFTFNQGILASFRRKKDAYQFLEELAPKLDDPSHQTKVSLFQLSDKDEAMKLLNILEEYKEYYCYDDQRKEKYKFDSLFIKKFISSTIRCFGPMAFRFCELAPDKTALTFYIFTNHVFRGLGQLNEELHPLGLSIFYNNVKANYWSHKIQFTRRDQSSNWFNLELKLSPEDLAIIQNSNLQEDMAVGEKQLVFLSRGQKELFRFMKKYTEHEAIKKGHEFLLSFHRSRIFELFELKRLGLKGILTPEEEKVCHNLATLKKIPHYPIPQGLESIMRPYQKTGFHWIRFLYEHKLGACLADDMGLGKTIQALAFLESIIGQVDRILIACPVSLILNWEKEFQKFSSLNVSIYHGGNRSFDPSHKIIITSYGLIKKEYTHVFKDMHFNIFILDEIQHLKNIRSLGAFSARNIKADFRLALTGTPVENDLSEFYNILDLALPGIWGDLGLIKPHNPNAPRLLASKTARPFILRRTKGQVLKELPPKIENHVYLPFDEQERAHYTKILESIRHKIALANSKHKYGEILKGILQLRQSCLWQKEGVSTKVDFLVQQLRQITEEGHKALVFSQFTTYLDIIQNYLHKEGHQLARVDGQQSMKKRHQQVALFQEGGAQIFLISLKAGGVGLNLTAASYVFIMDPWWNPAVEAQAVDRAHRIGQKNTLTVYRPIIKNSIEEKVLGLQVMKRDLFFELLPEDDEGAFAGKLTMKDFEGLLGL